MTATTLLIMLSRPLIGAVIGYITNDIAIRMLFRPHKAKYIGKFHIPFTPGIIPKEKGRIAAAIGEAISQNLMNRDVIEKAMLSDDMIDKIRMAIDNFFETQKKNHDTLQDFLTSLIPPAQFESIRDNLTEEASALMGDRLSSANIGDHIGDMATEYVVGRMKNGIVPLPPGSDRFIGLVSAPLKKLLARNINKMMSENAPQLVAKLVRDQSRTFLDMPMSELVKGKDRQIEQIKSAVIDIYSTIITTRLPQILEAVNISRIVEERINDMDMEESERLILQVMNRELKALVWLGALLGFVMGCVNLLF